MRKLFKISIYFIFLILFFSLSNTSVYASGDPIGEWVLNSTSLPGVLVGHRAVFDKGKIYLFGGANSNVLRSVYSSVQGGLGNVLSWNFQNNMLGDRFLMASAKYGSRVYILAGMNAPGSAFVNNVYFSTIKADGTLENWQETTHLPTSVVEGEAVSVGNKIYFAGGTNNSGPHDDIYLSEINSDGTLGSWANVKKLPRPLVTFGMVSYKNNIYIFGGNSNGTIRNEVYRATVSSDGSLSEWHQEANLVQPFSAYGQFTIVDNAIIIAGGDYGPAATEKVFYSFIKSDGRIDTWKQSASSLLKPITGGLLTSSDNYIYLIGGNDGNGYLDSVYYSKFTSPGKELDVPVLKQTDPAWGNQLYDSANLWAAADQRGINSWGCGITSAAMVFQYNNITKLPDGTALNPKTLNTWLKNRPLGYVREGWVNWAELAVLSKLAKSKNPNFHFDTLEYKYALGQNKDQLEEDIKNNIPGILEEPGHFIVARGTDGVGDFTINDPYYSRTNLSSYGNTFSKLIRFVPSNSDLSYIILDSEGNTNITLKNDFGAVVGDTFIQDPMLDDKGGTVKNGKPLRFTQFTQPPTGEYQIEVSSTESTQYSLDIILYDKNGNGKKITLTGITDPQDIDTYTIDFNKGAINKTSAQKIVTFDSLLSDLNAICSTGQVKIICPALIAQVKTAKNSAGFRPTVKAAISLLKAVDGQLKSQKGKYVSQSAYTILHSDLQTLIASL